jgi:preprotein translocase subunit SecD
VASGPASKRSLIVALCATLLLSFGSLTLTLVLGWAPKLGLDLAGGLSVVYKPTTQASKADLLQVVQILSNRVNGLGVSGASVNLQGTNVVVSVPGATNAREILASIGQTAQLLFRPVLCETTTAAKLETFTGAALPSCGPQYSMAASNLGVSPNPQSAAGYTMNPVQPDPAFSTFASTPSGADFANQAVLLPSAGNPSQRYILGPAQMTGTSLKNAVAQQDQAGAWIVSYNLTGTGSALWDQVASANFHGLVAIELDGVVQSAPIIQPTETAPRSFGGSGQISGSFTESSAKNLAIAMQFGSLPVRLEPLTTQTVSPTLGHSALVAGLGAGLAGLLVVLLYTIIYYRALGLVIVLGLGVSAAALFAIISALGKTALAPSFDLAGVTGLIVSIGITVDSFIVYFERLKDETRAGRTMRSSVDRGFKSAWRTVLAADLVSLLAAGLLYLIAVGAVRGFAFFLGLSTLLDIIVTWYFTRPLVTLLGRRNSESSSNFSMAAGIGAEVKHV